MDMSSNMTVNVQVPLGIYPGMQFRVGSVCGQEIIVTCPPGAGPLSWVSVPVQQQAATSDGRALFERAMTNRQHVDATNVTNGSQNGGGDDDDDDDSPIVREDADTKNDGVFVTRRFLWRKIPSTAVEFNEARRILSKTPEGAAVLLCMATLLYAERTGREKDALATTAITTSVHSECDARRVIGTMDRRMTVSMARSYVQGTTPGERYALPSSGPFVYVTRTQLRDQRLAERGYFKTFVMSSGADRPRPVTSKVDADGTYRASEFSSIQVDVCPAGIFRHWKEPRSENVLRQLATSATESLLQCLKQYGPGAEGNVGLQQVLQQTYMHPTTSFRRFFSFALRKALTRASLYATSPVVITRFDVTSSSAPQTLGVPGSANFHQGTKVKIFIAKKPGEPGMPAPLHLFFPKDGSPPTFTNIGSI